MAYWIQRTGTNHNNSAYRLFYAETEDDINNLPTQTQKGLQVNDDTVANATCAAGSECVVIATGNVYVLGKKSNTWDKFGGV